MCSVGDIRGGGRMEGCQTLTSLKRSKTVERSTLFFTSRHAHDNDTPQFSACNFCNSQHQGGVGSLLAIFFMAWYACVRVYMNVEYGDTVEIVLFRVTLTNA